MSASNLLETQILQLIFQNDNFANVGDATGLRGSSTAGVFWISLHTADPTDAGDQTSSEASYTGYARKSMARDGSTWTVSGNNASNAAALTFDECTAGSGAITHFGIGTDESGAGNLLFSGALGATLNVSAGITPEFAIGDLDVNAD